MIIFLTLVLIMLMVLIGGERGAMSIMTLAGNIVILFFSIMLISCTAPDIGGRCRCLLYFSVLSERK